MASLQCPFSWINITWTGPRMMIVMMMIKTRTFIRTRWRVKQLLQILLMYLIENFPPFLSLNQWLSMIFLVVQLRNIKMGNMNLFANFRLSFSHFKFWQNCKLYSIMRWNRILRKSIWGGRLGRNDEICNWKYVQKVLSKFLYWSWIKISVTLDNFFLFSFCSVHTPPPRLHLSAFFCVNRKSMQIALKYFGCVSSCSLWTQ